MSCSVQGCKNSRRFKPEGISFHTFPQGELLKQWLHILGKDIETWTWSKNKLVCSRHFTVEDYAVKGSHNSLRVNAVPFVAVNNSSGVDEMKFTRQQSDVLVSNSLIDPLQTSPFETEKVTAQTLKRYETTQFTDDQVSSITSTNSHEMKRKIRFIKSIHNYCTSPKKVTSKIMNIQKRQRQHRRRLYEHKQKISLRKVPPVSFILGL